VNNRYRYKISLACSAGREVRALVSKILSYCNTEKEFRGVSIYADMNPYD
jgi:primosomal protein N' (replication factor Y)